MITVSDPGTVLLLNAGEPAPAARPNTKSFSGNYLLWRRVGQHLRKGSPGGQGGNPRFRHPTFAAAEAEAQRLLGLFPESSFVILQEVARVKLKAPEACTDV